MTTINTTRELTDDERTAIDRAADKCYMEAERLIALDHGDSGNLSGVVRLVVMWMNTGDTLRGLLERTGGYAGERFDVAVTSSVELIDA